MVMVTVKDCAPVPSGGRMPPGFEFTVICHCVDAGVMAALLPKFAVKLPVESSPIGPTRPEYGAPPRVNPPLDPGTRMALMVPPA